MVRVVEFEVDPNSNLPGLTADHLEVEAGSKYGRLTLPFT